MAAPVVTRPRTPYCLACYAPMRIEGASSPCPRCETINVRQDQRLFWTHQTSLRFVEGVLKAGVIVVIAIGASGDSSDLFGDAVDALWVGLAWTLAAMTTGYALATAVGLEAVDRFTMAIELSVKNVGLVAIVAISALGRPELAVFAGAYVLTGYPLAVLASLLFRRVYYGSGA